MEQGAAPRIEAAAQRELAASHTMERGLNVTAGVDPFHSAIQLLPGGRQGLAEEVAVLCVKKLDTGRLGVR